MYRVTKMDDKLYAYETDLEYSEIENIKIFVEEEAIPVLLVADLEEAKEIFSNEREDYEIVIVDKEE